MNSVFFEENNVTETTYRIQSVICDRESFIQSLENIIIDYKVWFQQDEAKAHTSEVVI